MKVTVLEPSGFCTGVDRAINLAIKTKEQNASKNVVILGMLVHNAEALKTLENKGIKTIYDKNSSLEELALSLKEPSIVILTAHGHSESIEKILLKNGHEIVDATCPFVKNSFKEIKNELDNKHSVFYIGVKNHPEAIASLSLGESIYLIDAKNPAIPHIYEDFPAIISQTTLSDDEVKGIVLEIKKAYPNAKVINGICHASTERQEAIKNIPSDVDGIIVVGGSNSNNSKTLFALANSLHKDKKVFLIENETQINKKDLLGLSHIAISSGASTPKETIEQIKSKLLN